MLDDFLSYLASEKGVAKNTLEAYQRDIKAFLNFLGNTPLQEVQEEHIILFLTHLQEFLQVGQK